MAIKLSLPIDQNWSCHNCGGCCKQHGIVITEAERDRIANQGWTEADGVPAEWFVRESSLGGRPWYRMTHRQDGSCAFLDESGLCRIHGKFGEEAKPLACRIYPYAFHPAGGRMTVSLRFSCPSVVRNLGTPVSQQRRAIQEVADAVVPKEALKLPPAELAKGQPLDWDRFRIVQTAIEEDLGDQTRPIGTQLLTAWTWLRLLPQVDLPSLSVGDAEQTVAALRGAAAIEVDRDAASWAAPGRTALTHFRLLVGQYARKDTEMTRRQGIKGRMHLAKSAWSLVVGRGTASAIREGFGEVDFATLHQPIGITPSGVDEMIGRLLAVKIRGLHWCGRAFYGFGIVEGFANLMLIVPVIHWLARWNAATRRETLTNEHYVAAITSADHHHGFSPALSQRAFRSRVRFLNESDELRRIVQTYAVPSSSRELSSSK